jgi:hypothetical protein
MTQTQNITADLRLSLEAEIAAARAVALRPETHDTDEAVLYAQCGMVVTMRGDVARLAGTGDALAEAFKFRNQTVATTAARRWNAQLTEAQVAAGCAVEVFALSCALTRAIEEKEALLAVLAKAAA